MEDLHVIEAARNIQCKGEAGSGSVCHPDALKCVIPRKREPVKAFSKDHLHRWDKRMQKVMTLLERVTLEKVSGDHA